MPVAIPRLTFTEPFQVTVMLLTQAEANACIEEFSDREIIISRLNQTDSFILDTPSNETAFDFKFLGNAAPVARKKIATGQSDSPYLHPGDVFDFANIADLLTTGAKFLGVLAFAGMEIRKERFHWKAASFQRRNGSGETNLQALQLRSMRRLRAVRHYTRR